MLLRSNLTPQYNLPSRVVCAPAAPLNPDVARLFREMVKRKGTGGTIEPERSVLAAALDETPAMIEEAGGNVPLSARSGLVKSV